MRKTISLVILLAAAAACGDDGGGGETPDATAGGPDAMPGTPDAGPTAGCTCVALGADYASGTGTLSTVHVPDLTVTQNLVPSGISGDPVVRVPGDGNVYVVNRFGADNVTVLSAADFSLVSQFSTGAGSNPQDIAVKGGKAYVVGLALPGVQVYDLADPTAAPQVIDLSSFDGDGMPDAASIAIHGNQALVTLELLDSSFLPSAVGKVVVIDLASNDVAGSFDLTYADPTGFLRASGADFLVETADDYSGVTGCLERITTAGTPASAGCALNNSDVMGVVNAIAPAAGDVYVAVTSFDLAGNPQGRIVLLRADGTFDAEGITPAQQVVTDVAYCAASNQLVYADQATGGIRVWDIGTGAELTAAPLDIGLPAAYSNGIACF